MKDSTFTVRDGEFFCLLGPSGCGKTTTLRMIAGLELPTSGQIFLGDEDVTFKRASARDIAFVFQMFALYPHMNVRRNIAFPLRLAGHGARPDRAHGRARLRASCASAHLLDQPVSGLSSGDRQRVALGRAIVREPLAFLMDEPLGALDSEFREEMCLELRALHDRLQATTVYVTHDQLEAMAMADTIAVMNQGVVEQLGAPLEVYERPASVFVADFIGSPAMNFLPFEAALCGRRRARARRRSAPIDVPALREDVADARAAAAACGPSTCTFPTRSALRARGARHRIPRHQPDRHLRHRGRRTRCAPRSTSRAARSAATTWAWSSTPSAVSLFDARPGRALRTARDDAPAVPRAQGARHG